jgi:hypothetical protein
LHCGFTDGTMITRCILGTQITSSIFRAAAPSDVTLDRLGPLRELPGTWVGKGFNLVALPNGQQKNTPLPFFLKLNTTMETLNFTKIGGPIPNRGSSQGDIFFVGLHYFQQVSDAETSELMHVEPGLWLNLPVSTSPAQPRTLARLGTIPHGDSLLAQGDLINNGEPFPNPPKIDPVDSTPFTLDAASGARVNDTNPVYLAPYKSPAKLPPGITPAIVANPNIVLTAAISAQAILEQKIVQTFVLQVNANPVGGINGTAIAPPPTPIIVGGIENIPFVNTSANVNANAFSAIFWIETVENSDGSQFLQLQYTQTVILEFVGLKWPHISVATLVKQ